MHAHGVVKPLTKEEDEASGPQPTDSLVITIAESDEEPAKPSLSTGAHQAGEARTLAQSREAVVTYHASIGDDITVRRLRRQGAEEKRKEAAFNTKSGDVLRLAGQEAAEGAAGAGACAHAETDGGRQTGRQTDSQA